MCYETQGHYKSSDLSRILNTHFGKSMNLARIKVMSMMRPLQSAAGGVYETCGIRQRGCG